MANVVDQLIALSNILAGIIAQLQAPPAPPRTARHVITPADMTYLGVMKTPLDARSQGAIALRRRPDGTKSLLVSGPSTTGNPLAEITLATFNADPAKQAAAKLLNSWQPEQWQQNCKSWGSIPLPSGGLEIGGMVMIGDTLYSTFHGHYDVNPGNKPVLFASKFNADGTITSSGPWFIDAGNHQTCLWLTTNNGKLYAGAGLTAGDAASPWGRSLYEVQIPDAATPAFSTLTSRVLLTYSIGHEDEFPGTYTSATVSTPKAGGPWINNGNVTTAIWIDTPTPEGVLYFGRIGEGFVWYGLNPDPASGNKDTVDLAKGYHATQHKGYLAIDDPAKYDDVVAGKVQAYTLRADAVIDPFPMMGNLAPANFFTGAAFDEDTNTLILSGTWGPSGLLLLHGLKVGG